MELVLMWKIRCILLLPKLFPGLARRSGWSIARGYINIKKKITPWFSARVTPDLTRDGDIKVPYPAIRQTKCKLTISFI